MKYVYLLGLWGIFLMACSSEKAEPADLIFTNGIIYTVNESQPTAEAVAVKDGMILAVGSVEEIEKHQAENTELINLQGETMTPGLIESHAHLMGIGYNKLELDLMYVKTYDELVEKVAEAVAKAKPGDWITGRGWHQDKWIEKPEKMVKGFQTNDQLNEASPDNPVFLRHASGHAAFANGKALELAGISNLKGERPGEVEGGEIILDELGNPTGILSERASGLVARLIPAETPERAEEALTLALKELNEKGITSFHDAGSGQNVIDLIQKFKNEGKLTVRQYVMLTGTQPALLEEWYKKGPMIDSADHMLTVRSIKLNCDGALGNRGAWLLEDYSDRPDHRGHETLPMSVVSEVSEKAIPAGFQVCSHAIGDRANQEILDRYEAAFANYPDAKDLRFRIEHAQHIHPDDIPRFGELGVIAAMQAIHLSSDRPWAIDRLGEKRIVDGAYVWQKLMKTGAVVTNGTDAPVEPVDPIPSFYASVTRKTLQGMPEGGYEGDQKMTRAEALKSYTLDGAFAEFEEDFKGSIEVGKAADFTVFDKNIMEVPEDEILETKVAMTVVGGKVVYKK
ncbi:amidohydrolase [Algoriphagus halophytocola]|uniref:Amidohydrolase n=1 Tax=Algoriphagus halophytocola TaxID=2991499 RepID=A0ABY6MC45_9BACT|nr:MULTISPECIES: amidohydrolase [unclassified Algoriphagus]UZD21003.1 amidohydrolase [Algoriphagus sp. TR-M5]WBL42169.1 amidohydrolase [Algoriphagus sp. TR-M9]